MLSKEEKLQIRLAREQKNKNNRERYHQTKNLTPEEKAELRAEKRRQKSLNNFDKFGRFPPRPGKQTGRERKNRLERERYQRNKLVEAETRLEAEQQQKEVANFFKRCQEVRNYEESFCKKQQNISDLARQQEDEIDETL